MVEKRGRSRRADNPQGLLPPLQQATNATGFTWPDSTDFQGSEAVHQLPNRNISLMLNPQGLINNASLAQECPTSYYDKMSFGPFRFKYTTFPLQNTWKPSIGGDFRNMGVKCTEPDSFCHWQSHPGKMVTIHVVITCLILTYP